MFSLRSVNLALPLFGLMLLFSPEASAQFRLVTGGQIATQITFDNPTGPLTSRFYVLESISGSPVNFTATAFTTSGGNWLSVTAYPSATNDGTTGNPVEIRVNPNLPRGAYAGSVLFQQQGGPTMELLIPVFLIVSSGPDITASPSAISLAQVAGIAATQTVTLSSNDSSPFSYTAQLTSGNTIVTITAATTGSAAVHTLSLGSNAGLQPSYTPYTANLRIAVAGQTSSIDIPISLTVSPPSGIPGYTISPAVINLNTFQNQQPVVINPANPSQPYSYSTTVTTSIGAGWLLVVPSSSSGQMAGPQAFTVLVNPTGLVVGLTYTGTVRVIIASQSQDITVSFTPGTSPGGMIAGYTISPTSVSLSGGNVTQTVTIVPSSPTVPYFYTTSVFTFTGELWLTVTPTSSLSSVPGTQNFTIRANPAGLVPGIVYTGIVRILMAAQLQDITVTFTPAAQPLLLTTTSLNGGIAGSPYSYLLQATGGNAHYTWSHSGLPDGLALNPATGAITGSPTKADTFRTTITVRDSDNNSATATFPIVIQRAAAQTPKLSFVPVPPCRIMETRPEYNFEGRTGPFGPPFLSANETRTLTLPASNVCQIPATAAAFVLNVTVIPRAPLDFVTVFPGDESRPSFRTVSSPDGQTVANSTIVRGGTGGVIKIFASADTDILIDISGYFTSTAGASGLTYYPVSPCRAVDTRVEYRTPAGPFGPPTLNTREARRFRLPESPHCALPATASAYSATITAIPPGPLAYLTAWPSGGPQPNVSSINSFHGRVLANHAIIPAGINGAIDVFAFDRTDIVIDITGYFAPGDGVKGLYYFPLVQCRVADTGSAAYTGSFGPPLLIGEATRTLPLPASVQCPAIATTAKAYALNVTALPGGSLMPFLTVFPWGQPRPNTSMLNAFDGQTVTNSNIVSAGTGGFIDLFAYRNTHATVEISGYFAP